MVFVAEAIGSGLVHLGRSRNVDRRLKQLSASCPYELRVLRSFDGDAPELLELRLRLAPFRHHGGWYVGAPALAALALLTTIELDAVRNRCPRCGKPRSVEQARSDHRGKYCIRCSQKNRWAITAPEEKARRVVGIVSPASREKARATRAERFAELRRSRARCIDCGAALPIQPSNKLRADADRRCRSCGMRKAWTRAKYRRARRKGRAAFLARSKASA